MEKATEIFEKHWTKKRGKPLDEITKHHMKYAIQAINEALLLGAVIGCSCVEEYKHGETKIWCCNHCGKPTEKWWKE